MRRFALAFLVLALSFVLVDRAQCAKPPSGGGSATVVLNEVAGSGVTGKASLRALSQGGTRIAFQAKGLEYGVEYVAVYNFNNTCDLDATAMSQVLGRFRGNRRGTASVTVEVPAELSQIRSISARLGDGLALVACGPLN